MRQIFSTRSSSYRQEIVRFVPGKSEQYKRKHKNPDTRGSPANGNTQLWFLHPTLHSRKYLAMSGDIFSYQNWGLLIAFNGYRPRMVVDILTIHRTTPDNKKLPDL